MGERNPESHLPTFACANDRQMDTHVLFLKFKNHKKILFDISKYSTGIMGTMDQGLLLGEWITFFRFLTLFQNNVKIGGKGDKNKKCSREALTKPPDPLSSCTKELGS